MRKIPELNRERVRSESRYICKPNLLSLKCILNAYLGGRVYGNWRKFTGSYNKKRVYMFVRFLKTVNGFGRTLAVSGFGPFLKAVCGFWRFLKAVCGFWRFLKEVSGFAER